MRLMIIGQLEGYMGAAGKIALQRGAKVMHCEDTAQAVGALLSGKGADLVMIDIKQKIGAFVDRLRAERIHIPVVACGVGADARAAVRAIQDGAREYVPLPPDAALIAAILEAVTEDSTAMIGADPAMVPVIKMAEKIAPSEATILITGESGTGKEVMARFVHRKSRRKDGPFIAINCAAIPETLLESELFGHEKGAFTGATGRRIGKFEEATGGTLLLDEVSEMQPAIQAKFLRALQEREITRVGSNDPVKIDVRILATSNRHLGDSVAKGEFREDLYFRLNVVNLRLPPLRERPGDIVALAQFFADKYADANAMPRKKISAQTNARLTAYGWRGNVRELENTMHRAILLSMADEIEPEAVQLQDGLAVTPPPSPLAVPGTTESPDAKPPSAAVQNPGAVAALIGRSIADVERDMILNTLDHCIGNRTHAANILGISIRTLRNKLAQYRDEGVPIPAASGGES